MDDTFLDAQLAVKTSPSSPLNDAVESLHDIFSDTDDEEDQQNLPIFHTKPALEAKIRQLLRNINSTELQLCLDGCKEFTKLLRGTSGAELLYEYIRLSAKLSELLEAWERRQGKAGFSSIVTLISVILNHPDGKYRQNDSDRVSISRVLDKFARFIVEEKMEDLYKEIGCKERKRQKAALLFLGSVVRRGSLLAAEVAKRFDFKLPAFNKLSEFRKKKVEKKRRDSTRGAFVEFAMSFLEVGRPGLVRSVLQQKEMFSGILRGLGDDDDETVVYVLATLRDRVLTEESLVPPPLRSVLFGSVTLEQLVGISARGDDVLAAKVAYEVLLMVCIDPSNGLMPDLKRKPTPLKGNTKRLVDLMKKLKATESEYHKKLLLAIVSGRPSLASSYLDQLPYNLEDHTSPNWVPAVTLTAKVVSAVREGIKWDFLAQQDDDSLNLENANVQSVIKCICLRPFSRLVVNKGLLHSDPLIKHGTLRLLLEVLRMFNSFMDALDVNSVSSLKQKLQEEVRISLPDPQVLFTLLNSADKSSKSNLKRAADSEIAGRHKKKPKIDIINEDIDILVGGLNIATESILSGESVNPEDKSTLFQVDNESFDEELFEIWVSDEICLDSDMVKDAEVYFHCKVLEALKIYHHTLHDVFQVSYDVLKILPTDPLELPSIMLQSLLSLLVEQFCGSIAPRSQSTVLPPIYKRLRSFLVLFLHSSIRDVRQQAYVLAKTAMMSTGAFDHNPWEIGSWFLFLPGNVELDGCGGYPESWSISSSVVSFLCDAVLTVGENLVKYWDILKSRHSTLKTGKDKIIDVSPFFICVLEKCLWDLGSASRKLTLPEKSMISLYVCNTVKYLLQTQVEAGILAGVVDLLLSDTVKNQLSTAADAESCLCEWRPLFSLMLFAKSIGCQEICNVRSIDPVPLKANTSFVNTLAEVESVLIAETAGRSKLFKALYFTIACTPTGEVLCNLPSVMAVSRGLPGFQFSVMNYLGLDHSLMRHISELWPDMFYTGLGMSVGASSQPKQTIGNHASKIIPCTNIGIESTSMSFGSFLREASFYRLFPALIFCAQEHCSEIKQLLVTKASNLTAEQIYSSLRLVLFWFHQIQLFYRDKIYKQEDQCSEICYAWEQQEWRSEICYILVECILERVSVLEVDCGSSTASELVPFCLCVQEVVKTVSVHPAVTTALTCSFDLDCELTEEFLKHSSEGILDLCGERVCKIELHVLKLLTIIPDKFLAMCSRKNHSSLYSECNANVLKALKNLMQWILLTFKDKFNCWYRNQSKSIVPIFCLVLALARCISPTDLLELANWIFTAVEPSDSMMSNAFIVSPTCLAFFFASVAFETLSQVVQSPNKNLFCIDRTNVLDVTLLEIIYLQAFKSAIAFKSDLADKCLLNALGAIHSLIYRQDMLSFSMDITRVIASTPIKIISHCIDRTTDKKTRILCLLMELSPVHSSAFGHMLSELLSKTSLQETGSQSTDELLMLLPAAVSFIDSHCTKFGESSPRIIQYIITFFSRLLLDRIVNWEQFVSGAVFQVQCFEFDTSLYENVHDLFWASHLGKAVHMLKLHFDSSENNMTEKLDLFCSICPSTGALTSSLDINNQKIDSCPIELVNNINKVVANISLCYVLLFPEESSKCSPSELCDKGAESSFRDRDSSRVRFLDALVSVWLQIVNNFLYAFDNLDERKPILILLRSLEMFTLRSIYMLTRDMRNVLIQMPSLPFLEKMAKASLLCRFGDHNTLQTFRCILSSLADGKLPLVLILQLLLGHSELASAVSSVADSSGVAGSGVAVKPISSFLRSLFISTKMSDSIEPERYKSQLEVLRLLRLLFHLRVRQNDLVSEEDLGVNIRELALLLLSSYGATVSEIDLQISCLLSEIESAAGMDHGVIVDLDYLWGSALSVRKNALLNNDLADVVEEHRRSQFRDNFPIDSKVLIDTVLYYPYRRLSFEKPLFSDNTVENFVEGHSEIRRRKLYDPVFMLAFSVHSLSMSYLDPVEFAGLGLLAIALVSTASPDNKIRMLGYEVLGRFKNVLEGSQKKREITRLKLLLTYLQNGIKDEWQKIPSIHGIFLAEASVVLLDPTHGHYLAISKFLSQSPQINLKTIPLFHDAFRSSSVNFTTERLWILRLLYSGFNDEDDALIFIRNSVAEILLSVYASSLSDIESKELILELLKKCFQVKKIAQYLIENCCLILWLSSALSLSINRANGEEEFLSRHVILLLEVAQEIVSSESTMEWLQKHALEQLSSLSCLLLNLFVKRSKLLQKTQSAPILILKVIVSSLESSQKRKTYQPHISLSMRSVYQLYEAVDAIDGGKFGDCAEFGLKAILMSMPPTRISDLEPGELSKFLVWALFTALQSDSHQGSKKKEPAPYFKKSIEHMQDISLTFTLQRWLVASVILQRVSFSLGDSDPLFVSNGVNGRTLLTLMEQLQKGGGCDKLMSGYEQILAAAIVHLQQFLGMKGKVLPSVVAALSTLVLVDGSNTSGNTSSINYPSLWSNIRYPAEANPAWRWCFYQPSEDLSMTYTNFDRVDEQHACQKLLLLFLGEPGKSSLYCQSQFLCKLESMGIYEWERTNLYT